MGPEGRVPGTDGPGGLRITCLSTVHQGSMALQIRGDKRARVSAILFFSVQS